MQCAICDLTRQTARAGLHSKKWITWQLLQLQVPVPRQAMQVVMPRSSLLAACNKLFHRFALHAG